MLFRSSGFEAHRAISAPPALSVRIKFAVSVVTCIHAANRIPENGFSFSKRRRISASTGMFLSAHSILFLPSLASAGFATSLRGIDCVAVVIVLPKLVYRGESLL